MVLNHTSQTKSFSKEKVENIPSNCAWSALVTVSSGSILSQDLSGLRYAWYFHLSMHKLFSHIFPNILLRLKRYKIFSLRKWQFIDINIYQGLLYIPYFMTINSVSLISRNVLFHVFIYIYLISELSFLYILTSLLYMHGLARSYFAPVSVKDFNLMAR